MQDEKVRSSVDPKGKTDVISNQTHKQKRELSMADVTVKQLAGMVGIPVDKLLRQINDAGLAHQSSEDNVTDEEKQKLLAFLKKSHGGAEATEKKQITLKRKSVSTLKLSGAGGKSKTVNVEVRKKRTYIQQPELQSNTKSHVEVTAEALENVGLGADDSPSDTQTGMPVGVQPSTTMADEVNEQLPTNHAATEEKTNAIESMETADKDKAPATKTQTTSKAKAKAKTGNIVQKKSKKASVQISSKAKDLKLSSADGNGDSADSHKKPIKPEDTKARQEADQKARQKTLEEAQKVVAELATRGEEEPKISATDDDLGVEDAMVKQALEESFAEEERRVKRARGKDKERASSKSEREKERKISQYQARPRKIRLKGTGEHGFQNPTAPVRREVKISQSITVADVANQMSTKGSVVVKELFKMGIMANINQSLDQETAVLLVEELGHEPVLVSENAIEEHLEAMVAQGEVEHLSDRPPVVTIMGHVDHGKTSLLDYIRRTKVAAGEAGGITQHIGAYHVETDKGVITFLDTPGHAAFTAMRARGAKATDLVILVVAADDGVKPQTVEAIQHAKAAQVPIIVALNKMDKEGIDLDRVRNELSVHNVISEDWGGDTQFIPLSAHTGAGIDALLDAILLQSELLELKAPSDGPSKGVVIESRLDRGRGVVTSFLVQEGLLRLGDTLLAGEHIGRVRAMYDELGRSIQSAGPSIPVEVLGLGSVPDAGESFMIVPDEKKAREVAEFRKIRARESRFAKAKAAKLENIFDNLKNEEIASVNVVIKADVRGSMEAIVSSLTGLSTSEVNVNVISCGVGGITETDANLALTSGATIIGFNTRADGSAKQICDAEDIDIRYYSIIYDIIDDIKKAMSGLLEPERREEIIGIAEVRDVFRSSKFGTAAGCMVIEGTLHRNKPIRVLRDDVVVFEGELESLRRFKEDAAEVRNGLECGIAVKSYNDVKSGDKIEVFDIKIIKRTL